MALLVGGGGGKLRHPHMARIQGADQPADRAALARGIPALEQHAQRWPQLALAQLAAHLQAQGQQSLLGRRYALDPLRFPELALQVDVG